MHPKPKVYRPGGRPVTLPSLNTRRPNEPLMPPDPEVHRAVLEAALGRPLPGAMFKPEPSMATLGRAKAKGTNQEWVNPQMSPLTTQRYLEAKDIRRLVERVVMQTPRPVRQPADDTAAPLTTHLQRWLRGR